MSKKTIYRNIAIIAFLSAILVAFTMVPEDTKEEKRNLAESKKFYEEVFNKGNIAMADELMTVDFIEHEEFPGLEPGREGVKQFFKMFRTAFPDLKATPEMMLAKGDKVVSYIIITGTHKGEFMGMEPTGKQIKIKGIDIVKFKDGKAAEHWGLTDSMTMMNQLGAMPMDEHEGH